MPQARPSMSQGKLLWGEGAEVPAGKQEGNRVAVWPLASLYLTQILLCHLQAVCPALGVLLRDWRTAVLSIC